MVYDTVNGKKGLENNSRRYQGGGAGQEYQSPENVPSRQFFVVKNRSQNKSQDKHYGNLKDQVGKDITYGRYKNIILEQADIVPNPRETEIGGYPRLERQQQGLKHGNKRKTHNKQ
jgi:hypothetical protein